MVILDTALYHNLNYSSQNVKLLRIVARRLRYKVEKLYFCKILFKMPARFHTYRFQICAKSISMFLIASMVYAWFAPSILAKQALWQQKTSWIAFRLNPSQDASAEQLIETAQAESEPNLEALLQFIARKAKETGIAVADLNTQLPQEVLVYALKSKLFGFSDASFPKQALLVETHGSKSLVPIPQSASAETVESSFSFANLTFSKDLGFSHAFIFTASPFFSAISPRAP